MIAGTKQVREELIALRRGLQVALDEMARRDNQNRAREILLGIDARMLELIGSLAISPLPEPRRVKAQR